MINWGLANQGGTQNALQMGLQLGTIARQRENQNALLEQRQQALDLRQQQFDRETMAQQDKANAAAALQADTAAAMNGDEAARQRLLATNFERFQKVDAATKAKLAEESEVYGQAATFALSQRDPQAIRQAVIDFGIQNRNPEVMKIAQLPDDQMVAALRSQVFESGMVNDLMRATDPNWRVIPEGGSLVDTNNPQAVQSFQQGTSERVVTRTGTAPDGRRVVQYSDGTIEYAN